MLLTAASEQNNSFVLLEAGLAAIAIAAAFAWPRLGNPVFAGIERTFGRLARRRGLAVVSVGVVTFLLRLAILPFCPVPLPFLPDDFSFMLACDTFAHGRLANPTPAMWMHFETIHVDMLPTYGSMYFPAQGLLMAAGKVLFGSPWIAILIFSALMCAAICWMLQAWLPPSWALLGGFLAIIRLGLFSYRVNTYTGGGLITGLGGALALGALPRLMKTARFRYGMLMSAGIVLLALTRPYEGMLLCLPVMFVWGCWAIAGKNRPSPAILLRRAALPLLLMIAAVAWMGYYDYRAFGSPTTLPYTINRNAYAMAPYYVWQSLHPEPCLPARRYAKVLYRERSEGLREGLSVVSFRNRVARKSLGHVSVLRRFRSASSADHGAASLLRSSNPIPAHWGVRSRGWNGDRDLSHPSLPGAIYRGVLCDRSAGHASPALVEPRRQARRPGPGADVGDDLCSVWARSACLPSRFTLVRRNGLRLNGQRCGTDPSSSERNAPESSRSWKPFPANSL